eukprot:Gregarina_sp_Poly_1__1824@NODE_1473_length_4052_cov_207_277290_g976_i0_p6_GENE_NODE_1473_length_4052_cov_207_277290_g976_i0NODE_1473_length_4052_cov_207_277290_g976_i0_p6_ORF_typecomplete_len101_score4_52_NODE_1473_length_4052_cov_207_277290_g976_i037494051
MQSRIIKLLLSFTQHYSIIFCSLNPRTRVYPPSVFTDSFIEGTTVLWNRRVPLTWFLGFIDTKLFEFFYTYFACTACLMNLTWRRLVSLNARVRRDGDAA